MTPDETPPSREELAEDVAARLRASGLDAARDGDNVTVHERTKMADGDGASTGKNILTVLGVTLGGLIITLLASLVWFGLFFSMVGGGAGDPTGAGQRAGLVGLTMAALIGGLGALMTGWDRKTLAGERDVAALGVGVVLGVPLLLITIASLSTTLDALTRGSGKLGIVAAILFFGAFAYLGDRVFKQR